MLSLGGDESLFSPILLSFSTYLDRLFVFKCLLLVYFYQMSFIVLRIQI